MDLFRRIGLTLNAKNRIWVFALVAMMLFASACSDSTPESVRGEPPQTPKDDWGKTYSDFFTEKFLDWQWSFMITGVNALLPKKPDLGLEAFELVEEQLEGIQNQLDVVIKGEEVIYDSLIQILKVIDDDELKNQIRALEDELSRFSTEYDNFAAALKKDNVWLSWDELRKDATAQKALASNLCGEAQGDYDCLGFTGPLVTSVNNIIDIEGVDPQAESLFEAIQQAAMVEAPSPNVKSGKELVAQALKNNESIIYWFVKLGTTLQQSYGMLATLTYLKYCGDVTESCDIDSAPPKPNTDNPWAGVVLSYPEWSTDKSLAENMSALNTWFGPMFDNLSNLVAANALSDASPGTEEPRIENALICWPNETASPQPTGESPRCTEATSAPGASSGGGVNHGEWMDDCNLFVWSGAEKDPDNKNGFVGFFDGETLRAQCYEHDKDSNVVPVAVATAEFTEGCTEDGNHLTIAYADTIDQFRAAQLQCDTLADPGKVADLTFIDGQSTSDWPNTGESNHNIYWAFNWETLPVNFIMTLDSDKNKVKSVYWEPSGQIVLMPETCSDDHIYEDKNLGVETIKSYFSDIQVDKCSPKGSNASYWVNLQLTSLGAYRGLLVLSHHFIGIDAPTNAVSAGCDADDVFCGPQKGTYDIDPNDKDKTFKGYALCLGGQILAGGMRPDHPNQYWFDHVDGSCEVPGPLPMPEIDKDQTCTTDYNWSDCILSGQFGSVLSSSGVNVSIENTGETDVSFSFTDLNGDDSRVTIKAGVTQIDIAMSSGSQAIMGCDGPDADNPVSCSIKIVDYSPDPPDLCQISGRTYEDDDGTLWYGGEPGDSCDETCAQHQLSEQQLSCDLDKTLSIGSGAGDSTACKNVLKNLNGQHSEETHWGEGKAEIGCEQWLNNDFAWVNSPETTTCDAKEDERCRACACS